MKKKFFIILTIMIAVVMVSSFVIASTTFMEGGEEGSVEATLRDIANVMVGIAFLISVVKLTQIGMKIMFGPVNKKTDAKASLIPWAVGVFICILWLSLGNLVMDVLTGGDMSGGRRTV